MEMYRTDEVMLNKIFGLFMCGALSKTFFLAAVENTMCLYKILLLVHSY